MLLCIVLKVLCKVILNRIQEKIDATLRWQQVEFRAGRSCEDHIVTLRIILEQINEFQESLYLVFIDCEKAFDRLNHGNIWEALSRKGLPMKIIGLIEAQYRAFSYRALHNGVLSDPIRVVAGVMQACILSPLLFLIVFDDILVDAIDCEPNCELLWQPITMEHLNDFEMAYNVALLAQRVLEMYGKTTRSVDAPKSKFSTGMKNLCCFSLVNPVLRSSSRSSSRDACGI